MASRSMQTWDPFREMVTLRDAMDSLFENAMIQPLGGSRRSQSQYLPIDVMEEDDNFCVRASLPGVKPEDLNVTVVENLVTIEGELRSDDGDESQQSEQKKNTRYHVRERSWGAFSRQVALPTSVNANEVEAEFNDGILTLTLPKSEEAKPKRIQIQANGQKKGLEGSKQQKTIEGKAEQR